MENMRIGFIGAGRVGTVLGKWFSENGCSLSGYYSRNYDNALASAKYTLSVAFESIDEFLENTDAVFITVKDGAVKEVFEQVRVKISDEKIFVHCSGAMTAFEAFGDYQRCLSLHPLFPFSDRFALTDSLRGAYFILEGDEELFERFSCIIEGCGGIPRRLLSDKKAEYHAACVMASNLVCSLTEASLNLLTLKCGFTRDDALGALSVLMRTNLEKILAVGPIDALTGPVERNDTATIGRHLGVLDGAEGDIYRILSKYLAERLSEIRTDADYSMLNRLLTEQDSQHDK